MNTSIFYMMVQSNIAHNKRMELNKEEQKNVAREEGRNKRKHPSNDSNKKNTKKLTVEEIKNQKTVVVSKLDKNKSIKETLDVLNKDFGYYGKIVNISCPSNGDTIKGYAFIEFKMMKKAKRAAEEMDKSKRYTCSMKKSREEYLKLKSEKNDEPMKKKKKQKQMEDTESEEEEESAAVDIMEKALSFASNEEEDKSQDEEESSEDEQLGGEKDLSDKINSLIENDKSHHSKKAKGPDIERTVFVRNLPFDVEIDDIEHMFSYYYGPVEKVTVMPHKEYISLSNGSAFVLFKDKDSVDRLMRDVEMEQRLKKLDEMAKDSNFEKKLKHVKASENGGNLQGTVAKLEIEGRHPIVCRAISRDEANKKKEVLENEKVNKKDKRNSYLAVEGYVPKSSPIAATMPPQHLEKIQKNYEMKMQKLKNPVYHVSRTRLSVQNLPKNMTDKQLKELFLRYAESPENKSLGKPHIKYCRIEREKNSKKVDVAGNKPSKGFAFVEFDKHEHALTALRAINNNPHIFEKKRVKKGKINTSKRLIVEFALENMFKVKQREARLKKQKQEVKKSGSVSI